MRGLEDRIRSDPLSAVGFSRHRVATRIDPSWEPVLAPCTVVEDRGQAVERSGESDPLRTPIPWDQIAQAFGATGQRHESAPDAANHDDARRQDEPPSAGAVNDNVTSASGVPQAEAASAQAAGRTAESDTMPTAAEAASAPTPAVATGSMRFPPKRPGRHAHCGTRTLNDDYSPGELFGIAALIIVGLLALILVIAQIK
jgi:hypothetical protein